MTWVCWRCMRNSKVETERAATGCELVGRKVVAVVVQGSFFD